MGFLDKLKLTHKDKGSKMPPPPPAPAKPGAKDASSGSPDDLPPLPQGGPKQSPQPASQPSPQPSPSQPVMTPPASNRPSPQPSPKPAPQLKPSNPTPPKSGNDLPPPPPEIPEEDLHVKPPRADRNTVKERPKSPMDDIPKEVPSRQDMRKGMSDIPPIKIDPNQQKGMITDDHAKDLDVNKFVLPEEADIKPKAQPEPKPREATPPPQPAPTPSSPPRPEDSPLPIPRQQSIRQAAPNAQADDQFTGPLFVDIQTYENIQEALSTLKSELKDVTGDLDTITKLNGEEDEQFSKIVKKLEGVQDRILEIDADLFENA